MPPKPPKPPKPHKPPVVVVDDSAIIVNGVPVTPSCRLGYTSEDLTVGIFQNDEEMVERFKSWMIGQTYAFCEGKVYNFDTKQYEEACGGVSHGPAFYSHDVKRFLNGEPVVD